MRSILRMMPLHGKLSLIIILPLLFIVYLTIRLQVEKREKLSLIKNFSYQVQHSQQIMRLSESLMTELRFSYLRLLNKEPGHVLSFQRKVTDQRLSDVEAAGSNPAGFKEYTFLSTLNRTRAEIDENKIPLDVAATYYINTIYRLHTMGLGSISRDEFFGSINDDLGSEKIISHLSTFYNIIRLNIYNLFHSQGDTTGTLYGLKGMHDIYKSFEKELLFTSSEYVRRSFLQIKNHPAVRSNDMFLDEMSTTYSIKPDIGAEKWWNDSQEFVDSLKALKEKIGKTVDEKVAGMYRKEKSAQTMGLVYLALLLVLSFFIVSYTIRVLREMLGEIRLASQEISSGVTGIQLTSFPNDVTGQLAASLRRMAIRNKVLVKAAHQIGKGNFNVSVAKRSQHDDLAFAIDKMKNDLIHYTKEISAAQKSVTKAVLEGQEKERTRIGEELHDNINQLLTSAKLYLSVVGKDPANSVELAQRSSEILSLAIEEIRKLSRDLVMPSLRASLRESILGLVADLLITTDIGFTVDVQNVDESRITESLKVAIYRIVQEQIKNVLKYSGAQTVLIKVNANPDFVDLLIEDDGRGFDPSTARKGIGITNIINRVHAFDGYIKIESAPNEGCRIIAKMSTEKAEGGWKS